jgi:diguanylate cyclase (GGDEF)-like protein
MAAARMRGSEEKFLKREGLHLRITQSGRLRLFHLRDEILNKDRFRDDFGIVCAKRHWMADREVQLRFHAFPEPFSIILLDVDRLKTLNSEFHHSEAEKILRGIFEILRNAAAPHEAYRLGGDEGAAMLPGIPLERATATAEEIRTTVARTFFDKWLSDGTSPTVSLGVGTTVEHLAGETFEGAVERLRECAKSTRNTVVAEMVFAESSST